MCFKHFFFNLNQFNQAYFISKNSQRSCHSNWEDHHDLLDKRKATRANKNTCLVATYNCKSAFSFWIILILQHFLIIHSFLSIFFLSHPFIFSHTVFPFCLISLLIVKEFVEDMSRNKIYLFYISSNWLRRILNCLDSTHSGLVLIRM